VRGKNKKSDMFGGVKVVEGIDGGWRCYVEAIGYNARLVEGYLFVSLVFTFQLFSANLSRVK
jgi:hypothetical protein